MYFKERVCLLCEEKYTPNTGSQKYCGSRTKKLGCAYVKFLEQRHKRTYPSHYPENQRKRQLFYKYKMTPEDYEKLFEKQNGRCDICNKPQEKTLSVDHNHETGKVRGLLCTHCNQGLGRFKDNVYLLQCAIFYLTKYG